MFAIGACKECGTLSCGNCGMPGRSGFLCAVHLRAEQNQAAQAQAARQRADEEFHQEVTARFLAASSLEDIEAGLATRRSDEELAQAVLSYITASSRQPDYELIQATCKVKQVTNRGGTFTKARALRLGERQSCWRLRWHRPGWADQGDGGMRDENWDAYLTADGLLYGSHPSNVSFVRSTMVIASPVGTSPKLQGHKIDIGEVVHLPRGDYGGKLLMSSVEGTLRAS